MFETAEDLFRRYSDRFVLAPWPNNAKTVLKPESNIDRTRWIMTQQANVRGPSARLQGLSTTGSSIKLASPDA